MKLLILLFAIEHFLACIPLFILTSNIRERNVFLDQYFPQVADEQVSIPPTFYMICFFRQSVLHSFSLITVWLCKFSSKIILAQKLILKCWWNWLQIATKVAYSLSIIFPIFYLTLPFLQYQVFLAYHKFGHPWSKILTSQLNTTNESKLKSDNCEFRTELEDLEGNT